MNFEKNLTPVKVLINRDRQLNKLAQVDPRIHIRIDNTAPRATMPTRLQVSRSKVKGQGHMVNNITQ